MVDVAFASPQVVVLLHFIHGFQRDLVRIADKTGSNIQASDLVPSSPARTGRRAAPDAVPAGNAQPPTDLRRVQASDQQRVERYLALLSAKVDGLVKVSKGVLEGPTDDEIRAHADSAPATPGSFTPRAAGEFYLFMKRGAQATVEAAPLLRRALGRWAAGDVAGAAAAFDEVPGMLRATDPDGTRGMEHHTWAQAASTTETRKELERLRIAESSKATDTPSTE